MNTPYLLTWPTCSKNLTIGWRFLRNRRRQRIQRRRGRYMLWIAKWWVIHSILFFAVFDPSSRQCVTEDGKVLTRVCVVDLYSGERVLDELVKPAKPIIDYLTRRVFLISLPVFQIISPLQVVRHNCRAARTNYHHPRRGPGADLQATNTTRRQPIQCPFLFQSLLTNYIPHTHPLRPFPRIRPLRSQDIPSLRD